MSKRKIESLDEPMLGLATTRQLLAEITARIEVDGQLDYRTVDCDEPAAPADDPLVCSECGCSSYSSSADRALVWCSFCGQDVKPIPRSEYEARQKPKQPDPPEGVENPVVCGVYWSPVCRRFVFEFDGRYEDLCDAISYGATHFGFPHEDGTISWHWPTQAWRWRTKDKRVYFLEGPDREGTQVHLTYVCLNAGGDA